MVACGQTDTATTTIVSVTPSATESAIFFPRLRPIEDTRETMTGELSGQLVLVDNCLRVNYASEVDNTVTSYLLIWPPEYRLNIDNDTVQILNGTGQVVAHVGDKIWTDGGGVPESFVREENRGTCPGPYFEVGEEFAVSTPTPLDEPE